MTWPLVVAGLILLGVGLFGLPMIKGKQERPAEPSKEEAWDILARPVEHTQGPRFQQGLLTGLGIGLLIGGAAVAWTLWSTPSPSAAKTPPIASQDENASAPEKDSATSDDAETEEAETPTPTTFEIEEGSTAPVIAERLTAAGLVESEEAFLDRVHERGVDTYLRAGTFSIPAEASLDQVIDALLE